MKNTNNQNKNKFVMLAIGLFLVFLGSFRFADSGDIKFMIVAGSGALFMLIGFFQLLLSKKK